MGAALVILVLVATGETADPSTGAARAALVAMARRPVDVAVRETSVVPDEAEAAWIAADSKVDVVAEIGWGEGKHEHATVHLHGRDGRVLRAAELDFKAAEPTAERGRAIGFAIATMLADEPVAAGIVASTTAAEARAAAAAVPATPETSVASSGAAPPSTAPTTTAASVRAPPDRVAPIRDDYASFAIEGAGAASIDALGTASGAGPIVRLQWNVARDLGIRVAGSARWFTTTGHAASELGAAGGILWTFARGSSMAAGLRAEVGVIHDAFTEELAAMTNPRGKVIARQSIDRSGWAPTFLAGIEGDWRAADALTFFVALDVEASTRTIVAETQGKPSVVWPSLEGGLRISF